ncbi:MAG: EamA family transporter, partial [Achromobacter sp.]
MTPGLLYLLASVACSVTVAVLLKLARRWQVDVRQAIAMNYLVAALLCWAVLRPDPAGVLTPRTPWLVLAALGVLLPSVFLAMAAAVRHAGIVRSDAAQRLSLFIPLLAAFLLFGEPPSGRKLAAALLAAGALYCLLRRAAPAQAPADGGPGGGR